ncbi:MAG: LytTR family DNA-binding domain-containing protein [Solobacterium sp.]|nr:LytTR family DNA-binding domain-containing protein [Solobacterium sp.]
MRIRTTVIDDDAYDLKRIINELEKISSESEYLFQTNGFTDPDLVKDFQSDWFIVDIDLNGKSGFDAADRISRENPAAKIIFCTSHDDLVFQSFGTNVFYFVRKDKLHSDLIDCIKKYVRTQENWYLMKTPDTTSGIDWNRIVYFEVAGKDLYIHLSNGSELKERKTLKQVISELPENLFLQPSSSYLVNCAFITAVKDKSIVLKDSSEIPIVKERRKEVMQGYLRYNTWR